MDIETSFETIFASGALTGELVDFPQNNYIRGWGYLDKDVAPPMEYFNYLQNLSDSKDLYLLQTKANKGEIPTSLKNPNSLRIRYGTITYEYDGSTQTVINISVATEEQVKAIVK